MLNKCSVTGCYTNFNEGPKKTVFKFPGDPVETVYFDQK